VGSWTWEVWTIAIAVPILSLAGIALTGVLLPGTWLIVAVMAGVKLWQPDMVSWWTLLALVALATLGEGLEFIASALGAAKAGATKHGAIGAMVGALVGAIAGIPFIPPFGPIVGGALGAGLGAILAERSFANKTWKESSKAGAGAAVGRLLATLAKLLIAAAMALIACLAVFVA
jgi:uncharacterized protein